MMLPQPPFRRNNAGRLFTAFKEASNSESSVFRQAWANVFKIPDNDLFQLIEVIGQMQVLLTRVTAEIAESSLPIKDQFPQHSKSLREAISAMNFDEPWQNRRGIIKQDGALAVLEIYAASLPEEGEIPFAELNALQGALREFAARVHDTEFESIDLKKWILDMLKALDLGIADYFINGAESLRRSTSYVLGEMLRYQEYFVGEREMDSRTWSAPFKAFVFKISGWADSATKASRTIAHVKQLLLAGPADKDEGDKST